MKDLQGSTYQQTKQKGGTVHGYTGGDADLEISEQSVSVETLIWKYQNSLYQAAYSALQNRAEAQDAVQMTFIQYVRQEKNFESEEHVRHWLFRTVLNKAKDIRRSFWHRNKVDLSETIQNMSFEQPVSDGFKQSKGYPALLLASQQSGFK